MEDFELPVWFIDGAGSRVWYLESKGKNYKHRLGGPAVDHINGTKEWWVNGQRHRIGKPAIIWKDGSQAWYVNDKLHRLDGPAYEVRGQTIWWYIEDILLPREEVEAWIKENKIDLTSDEGQLAFKIRWSGISKTGD